MHAFPADLLNPVSLFTLPSPTHMPSKSRKPAKTPPNPKNPAEPNESPTLHSMNDLLELQKKFLEENDAVLFYDVRLETRTGRVVSVRGTTTLSGIMSRQRMNQASKEVEDHIEALVQRPFAGVLQNRASDAVLKEATETDQMFDELPNGVSRIEALEGTDEEPQLTIQDVRAEPT